ncbi:MAG: hypothetical protein Q8P81_02355, partial [Nanoarchaeota archaeon]|nr:hypothetical protein [Nanoarchaeota archaeon]
MAKIGYNHLTIIDAPLDTPMRPKRKVNHAAESPEDSYRETEYHPHLIITDAPLDTPMRRKKVARPTDSSGVNDRVQIPLYRSPVERRVKQYDNPITEEMTEEEIIAELRSRPLQRKHVRYPSKNAFYKTGDLQRFMPVGGEEIPELYKRNLLGKRESSWLRGSSVAEFYMRIYPESRAIINSLKIDRKSASSSGVRSSR